MDIYMAIVQLAPHEVVDMIIDAVCIQNVKNHLTKLDIDPIIFLQSLHRCGCIISGSFILACYLNEPLYYDADIDIYGLYDNKHKRENLTSHPLENEIYNNLIPAEKKDESCINQYNDLAFIAYCRQFNIEVKASLPVIQFISVRLDPLEFIKIVFDFNETKVGFDGDNIHTEYPSIIILEKKININRIQFAHILQQNDIHVTINLNKEIISRLLDDKSYINLLVENIAVDIPFGEDEYFNLISYNGEKILVKVKNGTEQFVWPDYINHFKNNSRTPITNNSPQLQKHIKNKIYSIFYDRNYVNRCTEIMEELYNHVNLIMKTICRIKKYAQRGWKFVTN